MIKLKAGRLKVSLRGGMTKKKLVFWLKDRQGEEATITIPNNDGVVGMLQELMIFGWTSAIDYNPFMKILVIEEAVYVDVSVIRENDGKLINVIIPREDCVKIFSKVLTKNDRDDGISEEHIGGLLNGKISPSDKLWG